MTGSAIGRTLLESGKGVGQSGPFTVGNRPCDGCCGDYMMLCEFGGQGQVLFKTLLALFEKYKRVNQYI